MSVLACDRSGCENIMCNRLSNDYGYICDECFAELCARRILSIGTFMNTPKDKRFYDVEYSEIFRLRDQRKMAATKKKKKAVSTKSKRTENLSFALSYDTACSLQAIITQQWGHATRLNNDILVNELEQINRFYLHLTDYVEKNS